MRDFGYVEGKQFDFTHRFADGYVERLPALAEELVRLNPSVIVAPGSGPAVAAKKATATIPIVAPALGDAVHLGLIASEERPGGNVTGISPYVPGLPAKQLEFAREILPGAGSIGVLANLVDPKAPPQLQELRDAGQKMGIIVVAAEADTPGDLDSAIQSLVSQRTDVIIVLQTSRLRLQSALRAERKLR
jgi:putative ABC transport system substrate-binding protein